MAPLILLGALLLGWLAYLVVERVRLDPATLTYRNEDVATVWGAEASLQWAVSDWTGLHVSVEASRGRTRSGEDVAHATPLSTGIGLTHERSPWRYELRLKHRRALTRVAMTEQPIDAANLLAMDLSRTFAGGWSVSLWVRNALNDLYLETQDDKSPFSAERSVGVTLGYN